MFILIYKFKQVEVYYIIEIKLINFVERFYNEKILVEICRTDLAHLALMGKPPLIYINSDQLRSPE